MGPSNASGRTHLEAMLVYREIKAVNLFSGDHRRDTVCGRGGASREDESPSGEESDERISLRGGWKGKRTMKNKEVQ